MRRSIFTNMGDVGRTADTEVCGYEGWEGADTEVCNYVSGEIGRHGGLRLREVGPGYVAKPWPVEEYSASDSHLPGLSAM